jgi:hypothetical protein
MISKWDMVENLVDTLLINNPKWRLGQAYFNALCCLDSPTVEQIRGTENDCFYQDEKIPLFKIKVLEIWND